MAGALQGLMLIFIFPILLSIALFFISRTLFRIAMFITTVLFIISILLGFFVLRDAYSLNSELSNYDNAYLLQSESNTTVAGFVMNIKNQQPQIFDSSHIVEADSIINNGSLQNQSVKNFFIVNVDSLADNSVNMSVSGFDFINQNNTLELLNSKNATLYLANLLVENDPSLQNADKNYALELALNKITGQYADDTELKSQFFLALFAETINEVGPKFIFIEAKKDKLSIYPNRLTFRFIHYVPDSIIELSQEVKVE